MTTRVVSGVFLALVLLTESAAGQIPVRSVDEVGTLERVGIAVKQALLPGLRVFFPLYAYEHELVCSEDREENLAGAYGPAAIVTESNGVTIAYYYQTVAAAVMAVDRKDWCNREDLTWHVGTTLPLDDGVGVELQGRYLSTDVDRIEALLQRHEPG